MGYPPSSPRLRRNTLAGGLVEWVILNPNGQPDWGHFGTTALQQEIRNAGLTVHYPPQKPVYLRLGFQNANNVHSGFGLVHILFSRNRKAHLAIAEDLIATG